MSFRNTTFLAAALGVCLLASDLMAQPGGGGGRGGRQRFGGFGAGMQVIGMLTNEDVREKADITEDQYNDIKGVQEDMQSKMRDAFQDRDFEALRGISEDAEKEIKEILLDKQWKMVQTIANQQRYIRGGQLRIDERFLTDQLGLSEDEAKDAMESYDELRQKIEKEVAKLAEKMIADFAKELPADARKKFKELIGDEIIPITQQRPQFGGRGQGGRGQGGRGQGGRGQGGRGQGGRPQGDDF